MYCRSNMRIKFRTHNLLNLSNYNMNEFCLLYADD